MAVPAKKAIGISAAEILAFDDLKRDVVLVPYWNCEMHIRELGLESGLHLFSMVQDMGDEITLTAADIAQVIVWGVIDPATGQPLFSDDDVPALAMKNQGALMALYKAITELSGDGGDTPIKN